MAAPVNSGTVNGGTVNGGTANGGTANGGIVNGGTVNSTAPAVYGLILTGGLSSRMHRDKAALIYQGKSQLDRAFELASRHAARVFVSVRSSQAAEPTRAHRPLIIDSVDGEGPIVGIRSAFAAFPGTAWLVLACDLPFLSDAALEQLLAERDPGLLATAYRSTHDGLPEPLCALWEPAAAAALSAYQAGGERCPRKFLIQHPHAVRLLEPRDRHALDNVNTPEEYAQAQDALATHPEANPMQLTIQYFALMREQAGRSEETLETLAATPADLYAELNARYGFTLSREQLKVAVNSEFSDWSRRLSAGDAVVFIPPVAGG
jgi:molybdenum cofactor guanylyltransferase